MNTLRALAGALTFALLTACGGGPIEITGTFTTAYGTETITEETWDSGFAVSSIEDWDNDANWAVTKSAPDAMYNPDTYSRVVWTEEVDGKFHYCIVAYGLETLEAAQTSTLTADATSPDTTGCGAFPWTAMSR